jgi:hypothetical protein
MGAGLNHGFKRGYVLCLGLVLGIWTQLLAVGVGLGALVATSSTAFAFIKWAGVAYLVWLGLAQWRASSAPLAVGHEAQSAASPWQLVRRGWAVNTLNPKGTVFLLAVVPQFMDLGQPLWPQYLVIGATLAFTDLVLDGDGSDDTHAQFGVSAGSCFHEDIYATSTAKTAPADFPVWYFKAGNLPRIHDSSVNSLVIDGLLCYNSGGLVVPATDGYFVMYHIFFTNDCSWSDSTDIDDSWGDSLHGSHHAVSYNSCRHQTTQCVHSGVIEMGRGVESAWRSEHQQLTDGQSLRGQQLIRRLHRHSERALELLRRYLMI